MAYIDESVGRVVNTRLPEAILSVIFYYAGYNTNNTNNYINIILLDHAIRYCNASVGRNNPTILWFSQQAVTAIQLIFF